MSPPREPKNRLNRVLLERAYIVDGNGSSWQLRLSHLDRPISVHRSSEEALRAALKVGRDWAPARIRVIHGGQLATEWYIRFPDGQWQEVRLPDAPPSQIEVDAIPPGAPTPPR